MNQSRWQQIKAAFDEALKLEPALRLGYFQKLDFTDADLRRRVELLLTEHENDSDAFLCDPAASLSIYGDLVDADSWLGKHIGPYELVQRLGSGGMGDVYLAKRIDAEFERTVAVKLIRRGHESADVVARFKAERQILAGLDHPNIAKLLDGGHAAGGQPYFVMEYVPGVPIVQYCDMHDLSIKRRIELMIQACEGVQHAHQNAVIHRDLKPSNILIVEVDGKPMVRIIDFGLAKTLVSFDSQPTQLTKFGIFMGTPGYISPEQADVRIRNVDTRTDVYSLGVILYLLLTGVQPFETVGQGLPPFDEWLRRLREDDPARPSVAVRHAEKAAAMARLRRTDSKLRSGQLRGDLDWITMKTLERDRERRYATPLDLAADLRRYMNDEPVTAGPASTGYQIRKLVRRHRFATAFVGVVMVLSLVASGAALIAVEQKREAEHQSAETLKAQSRLLIQAAAQRLGNADVPGAQGIILEVLTNPRLSGEKLPSAISVFQDVRAADAQRGVLSGHEDFVASAAFSPNGARVATASGDGTARIWDANTGAVLGILRGHSAAIYAIEFSPDGRYVVTASDDATARVWDANSGTPVSVMVGHNSPVSAAHYSPDGMHVVTASADATARVWNAQTGGRLLNLSGHGGAINSATYSPDGSRILTASDDKTARIWDARTGALIHVLSGHGGLVHAANYSPDGARIVTSSDDGTARVWSAHTGKPLAVLSGHRGPVRYAAFSPDGARIVTASGDTTARLWDSRRGACLAVLSGHRGFVEIASYSPSGDRIVTAADDNSPRLWDAHTGAALGVLSGHKDHAYFAGFSSNGKDVVTASRDHTARLWDGGASKRFGVLSGHTARIEHIAYSPDGSRLVTGAADNTARIWEARTLAQIKVLRGHTSRVFSAEYSLDSTRIVTTSNDGTARIWDALTGAHLAVLKHQAEDVMTGHFSPDGTRVVTAASTGRVWDAHTAAQLAILAGHSSVVEDAIYSPDGTHIATASRDRTARIWDARTGAQIRVLSGHDGVVFSVGYSPDGSRVVTASADKTARIWDAWTGMPLMILSGHDDAVWSARFSPDGTHIVTTSADKTARIWDAHSGAQLASVSGNGAPVMDAAYSPDGTRLAVTAGDNASVWDARVQADTASQILWYASSETDAMSDANREQLGLPPKLPAKWRSQGSACDRAASAVYDPDRVAAGQLLGAISVDIAKAACSREIANPEHSARADYEMGRTFLADGDAPDARREFEIAMNRGYAAARIDLADMLLSRLQNLRDTKLGVSLLEQAWMDHVTIAADKLGSFYEYGITVLEGEASAGVTRENARAMQWYRQGAAAGEPTAIAHLAEREELQSLNQSEADQRNRELLAAFQLYARAANLAQRQGWPADAWQHWRYRRASLSRFLASAGLMQQVADTYAITLAEK
jgi:WD40 repeat protein/serine/threonine protein kinase/TPR repeat protein